MPARTYLSAWRQCARSSPAAHNYIGHNYMGHDYMGHNYIGHSYIGHNYVPERVAAVRPVQPEGPAAAAVCGPGHNYIIMA